MDRAFDVMVAGHLCLDIIPRFPDTGAQRIGDLLQPGKLVNVGAAALSTGGPVSNTGINLRTLGHRVCFCARVGDDALGQLTVSLLQRNGNADGVRTRPGTASSYTIVIAPPGIDRIFLHNPGANDTFGPEDLDPVLIARCRHFHFGYPPLMQRMYAGEGEALERMFQIARRAGATTSCDMTLPDPDSPSGKVPWRKVLARILPHVDFFLPSIEETYYMMHPDKFLARKREHRGAELIDHLAPAEFSHLAEEVLSLGTRLVALKSGHRGFYVRTASAPVWKALSNGLVDVADWAGRELWAPAFAVEQFGSATGSGDSAIAGFLAAMLRGMPIARAAVTATAAGWQNVQVLDAVSGARTWEETCEVVARRLPHIDAGIQDPGWNWDDEYRIWVGPSDSYNCR